MESINDRFRIVLKESNLSQEKFAERINRSRGEIANIVYDKTILKEDILKAVCEKFNISEKWLREGIEPMRQPRTRYEEVTELVAEQLNGDDSLIAAVALMLSTRTPEQIEDLKEALREIVKNL